jgi:myo-inositol-1(or 4)-monophosphatase
MSTLVMPQVCDWAHEAGEIAMGYFNKVKGTRKADKSLVSQADVEMETLLRERIMAHYPTHGIMGEEQGIGDTDQEYVWCLDPLDGTEGFLCGLPVWGVSIGILHQRKPLYGVVYLPVSNDCFWNDANGAYWNGNPIHVSEQTTLESTDWIINHSKTHLNYDVSFPGKMRSFGSFAAHFCYVARATTPAALIGCCPNLWDIAAGMAILHAAGGVTTTLPTGKPLDIEPMFGGAKGKENILASPPALVSELIRFIKPRQ